MHTRPFTGLTLAVLIAVLTLLCSKDLNAPIDLTPPRGSISGKVTTSAGQPLSGVNVTLNATGISTISDAAGAFTLEGLRGGSYELICVRTGYLNRVLPGVSVGSGQDRVLDSIISMTVATAVIQGTVTSNGVIKPGVGVAVVNQSASTITDLSGAFTLPDVQPDGKLLLAADGSNGFKQQEIALNAGQTLQVSITITPDKNGGYITGIVVDNAGQPQAGVVVEAVGGGIRDTTTADGRYKLNNVPTSVPVEVTTSSGSRVSGLRVDQGGLLTNIDLRPATTSGTGSLTVQDGRYVVPFDSLISITAPIVSGAEHAAFYLWDLNCDGRYDTVTAGPQLHNIAAIDTVGFGVVTTGGDTVTDGRIVITRVTSRPAATALPATAAIRRREMLTLQGLVDCQTGGVRSFNWDFDGNGSVEWTRPDAGTVSHRYNTPGVFNSIFIVTGTTGLSDTDTVVVTVSVDSVILSDSDLVAPVITTPQQGDTVPPTVDVMLEPFPPPAETSYLLLIGQRTLDSLIVVTMDMYMVFLEGLAPGEWYLMPGAARGSDTLWGDVTRIFVRRLPPELDLSSPISGDTASGDSVMLKWYGWSHNSHLAALTFDVRLDENVPPGVMVAQGLQFEISSCSLQVAPATGWTDSTMYYWEVIAIDGADTTSKIDSLFYISGFVSPVDSSPGATFVPGPPMNSVHIGPTVARLPDNRIVVFGGHDQSWQSLTIAEIWDPVSDDFEVLNMNFSHDFPAFARLQDGTFLLAGGAENGGSAPGHSSGEIFDPAGATFTPLDGQLTTPRCTPGAATLTNGQALIVGGWYDAASCGTAEFFNPLTGLFALSTPLATQRARPMILPMADSSALIVGGLPIFGGTPLETIDRVVFDDLAPGVTPFSSNLVEGQSGWLPVHLDYYMCEMSQQLDGTDRYILLANQGTSYTLAAINRTTQARTLLPLSPALPSSDSVAFYSRPVIDATANKAYLLAHNTATTAAALRLYTIDLATNRVNSPGGWFEPSEAFGISGFTLMLRADGKIMAFSGSTDGNASTGTVNTWVMTPQ